ncbi:4a-hydroxytetrahydrobiopterin dehydratase [Microbacterium sp. STN6]|uniref:VOC family protein n=1 Tax=Microbacterium sp. STN6 TaxID=2995588 RepID=UPI002261026A|nr:VOC family protein [Microbacterium sp. STN6]MCX7521284.1 4a-hydroxytetrahydrobiopterin dehydratase [Microbacterium sp. STN6]
MTTLTPQETSDRLESTVFVHLAGALHATYSTSDFATAAALVASIAVEADAMNHHPDVRLGYGSVGVELSSHDEGGVTDRDIELAERIQGLADAAGATTEHVHPSGYELGIDTVDAERIRPFWRAAMDYAEQPEDNGEITLVDPRGVGPAIWFQHMDPPRTDRNRIHLDVYVPSVEAEERVRSVLENGGTLVTDEHAPSWWVLADVEGNELCICTSES